MTPEEAVIERLGGMSAVTALVSTRIYLLKLPQQPTLPAIRVQLVGAIRFSHLRGGVTLGRARVQVDAFAAEASGSDPYASVAAVADAVHGDEDGSGLAGWRGDVGGSPPLLQVTGILGIDRGAGYDPDHLRLVRMRQDYTVWFRPVA